MGQKVHPYGFRVGITKPWLSTWVAGKSDYGNLLVEDRKIRDFIKGKMKHAGISRITIERTSDEVRILIHTARPAIVMGRHGTERERLRDGLSRITDKKTVIDVSEVQNPEVESQLVAESIAEQLVRRASFRRAMRRAVTSAVQNGAYGVKIRLGGRLGGADMGRVETTVVGSLPLHTLDADVDYGFAEANTIYGVTGVKVWIYKGKIVKEDGAANGPDA
ncbi:MAG: 30S ribosomal protein S3 [Planctomycetes bacterium]|nr:30S ribosomal protein S3 [Planctomycetota bacterium]